MQTNTEIILPAPHSNNEECGANPLELKQSYATGEFNQPIPPEMINDHLLEVLFDDLPPINNRIH